jgi:hypothetical protein
MQTQPVAQPGKPALLSGIIIGVVLGIIHSSITIIIAQMAVNGGSSSAMITSLQLLVPLLWIIGFLFAGFWASKESGLISTGTLAGLFAGIFGSIIAGFGQIIATAITANLSSQAITQTSGMVLFTGYTAIFSVMILAIGAGAGVGAIGGLIGQSISNVRPQVAPQPLQVYAQPVMPYPYPAPQPMAAHQAPQPQSMAVPQTPQPQMPQTPILPEQ